LRFAITGQNVEDLSVSDLAGWDDNQLLLALPALPTGRIGEVGELVGDGWLIECLNYIGA